ncbi:Ig-like domain-containing protein, partial [Holdemanella porci]|uniref:Ig-like domain-containing protein n=1 Tax=Holdemanella porci TaxID=2652276 RepID=UPI003AB2E8DA
MLKNLKKAAAIVLSFAMAVQFGLADSYYVNAVEEPVEPQQEETTTTAPQEQEEVPTTEEETPQQQEEGQQQPAVEEEQPAAEEAQPQPQPVEQAEVKVSYVKEDDTDLMESVTATYDVGYRLDQDTNVFKEAHEAFEFEYAFVNGNKENKITKDQVKASGLTVTSDMTSLTLVYKEKASTEKPKKANKQEPAKTETTSESDDASDADTTDSQETAVQLTEFFVVASQNQVTKGETAQLTLTIKPDNYPNKDVTWSSSNEATATVDENGLVTTHEVGTVTITATLKSDPAISSSVTIVVNPIKVSKITVTGYDKKYLVKGDTVTLGTTVEPSDAANKSIVWSSSNEEVATVDQSGKVTAVGQGTVSIKALNDDSGVYGEQVITVYDNTPYSTDVYVYVTNRYQKTTYKINIPKNGVEIAASSVAQNSMGTDGNLVTKGALRVLDTLSDQPNWSTIASKPIVTAFRYYNGKLQYKTTSNSRWTNVDDNQRIYDFSNIQYKADETGSYNKTDVKITIGDWPYRAGEVTNQNKKTIQIQVYNNETQSTVYDSGVMRYSDGSNGDYGKINFNCDESKYEVVKVERYYSESSNPNYRKVNKVYEDTIPTDLSVQFTYNPYNSNYQHYKYIAYVQAKTIHVNYDANKGTGAPKETTVKSTEKVTVDSTTRPTREGYIFTGWTYGGKLYQGGETFDAPTSDVTFVAQWVKASDVINYTVNDSKMGKVSRSYERIGETVQGGVQGSTAIAKTGYRFVKWVEGTNPDGNAVSTEVEFKPTTKGTYMAVFEAVTSDLVVRYVDTKGKDISASETKNYKYGESYTVKAKEIKGYSLTSEATITGTKGVAREEIRFTYTQKIGKVVYNLGPKGSWGNGSPENVEIFDSAKGKWAYNYGFDKGDTFVVTDKVPTSSDNAVFVGWYDKKRDNTPATMRKAGNTVTYPYTEASDTNTYTLDALWEKLQGTNKKLPYDGKEHSLDEFTVKFANENLQGWTESASSLVKASNIQYRLKQDGREVNEWGAMPRFKDAGTYTIVAKATVNGVELTAEATLTITRKAVTVTADNKSKVFGEKNPELTATVTGTLGEDTV